MARGHRGRFYVCEPRPGGPGDRRLLEKQSCGRNRTESNRRLRPPFFVGSIRATNGRNSRRQWFSSNHQQRTNADTGGLLSGKERKGDRRSDDYRQPQSTGLQRIQTKGTLWWLRGTGDLPGCRGAARKGSSPGASLGDGDKGKKDNFAKP